MKNGEDLARKLLALKKQIESEKSRRSELQGELKSAMAQLEQEFGLTSVEAAEKQLAKDEKELLQLEADLRQQLVELEEMMEAKE